MTDNTTNSEAHIAKKQDPDIFELLARTTLAGLGGALAGLSVARRRGTFGAATGGILGRRVGELSYTKSSLRLPIAWAIGCTTFAGILEFSSLISPTSLLLNNLHETEFLGSDETGSTTGKSTVKSYVTSHRHNIEKLGDFAIGGAIAGSFFKGNSISESLVKNNGLATSSDKVGLLCESTMNDKVLSDGSYKQKKAIGRGKVIKLGTKNIDKAKTVNLVDGGRMLNGNGGGNTMAPPIIKGRTGIVSGLLPGLTLGLIAGLVHIFFNQLNATLKELELQDQNGSNGDEGKGEDDNRKNIISIEENVKKMSTAEIQHEIEKIKIKATKSAD